MKKFIIIIGIVFFALYAFRTEILFYINQYTEKKLEADCPAPPFDDVCLNRMRAAGHIFSKNGELNKAKHWYSIAAENNDEVAMFNLAWVYQELAIASPDNEGMEQAMEWYRKSAEKGFAPAMNNLGQLYLSGTNQDAIEALKWHMVAAKAGNPAGTWNVMIAYRAGHGVAEDETEAKKWELWDPKNVNPKDIISPIIERTTVFGSNIPAQEIANIRQAVKEGVPLSASLSPLKPDPSIPTFRERMKNLQ